jgi:SAM-dependent methyltransferase
MMGSIRSRRLSHTISNLTPWSANSHITQSSNPRIRASCAPIGVTLFRTPAKRTKSTDFFELVVDQLPQGTNLGLGCGAPVDHLELVAGETVLDLGSGAGIDALIAAAKVGPSGHVIGVDMTPEMVSKAAENAAGADNVEFRQGRLEELPVDDNSVDAVTSNCVINLVPDKSAVFGEIGRVLPQELAEVAAASGVTPEDVKDIVRSITYRAWKR